MEKKNKYLFDKAKLQLRLKILIYVTMIIIVCTLLWERALIKGTLLGVTTLFGIIAVDVRQINREIGNILKKLYICIDLDSYDLMSKELCSNIITPFLRNQCSLFFELLKNYYQEKGVNNENPAINENWNSLKNGVAVPIIKIYSQIMTGDKIKKEFIVNVEKKIGIDYISRHFEIVEAQNRSSYILHNELLGLRETAENNLQFAQINYLLSKVESSCDEAKYYRKIACNIAPKIYSDIEDAKVQEVSDEKR